MKIRSITYFLHPGWPLDGQQFDQAGAFLEQARPAFEAAGFEVQTARLATPPFPELSPDREPQALISLAGEIEQVAAARGFSYVSLGPALPDDLLAYTAIPAALAITENVFFSGLMTSDAGGLSLPAVRACAEVIHQAAPLDPNGFANLRFAALANVPAGSPFFPAAYHRGAQPSFAIATEAADLAVTAFRQADDLANGAKRLTAEIERQAAALRVVAAQLVNELGIAFGGVDFSLAPFPSVDSSIGTALEAVGVPAAGQHGSLAAAAILADAIDKAQFQRCGFSGLLLPPLEDATLAARAAEGILGVKDLLMYSAVCGTGLDTIPLPGDTRPEQLAALLLDLAALALRLDKPLTARLMPIPGKQAGEKTSFDFDFFANSRVLPLAATALRGHLAGEGNMHIGSRKRGDNAG